MACAGPCVADLLNDALGSAYEDNADLNAARAELRGVDENVPQALSGYRPTIRGDADAAVEADRVGGPTLGAARSNTIYPRGVSLTVDQPLFLGFRTTNSVKQAKNAVRAARAQLRNVEQQTLLAAVKAFMNVVLAQVVLNLRAQNIVFLREQLRAANDRLEAREGTPTDVAQANGALQGGIAGYAAASAAVTSALATYEQVIGHRPTTLGAADHVERFFPKTQQEAIDRALANHPSIVAARFNIDVASYSVKVLEGAKLPSLGLQGTLSHRDATQASGEGWEDTAALTVHGSVPIYAGGRDDSQIRQAKETLGQRRIELDLAKAQVQQEVISAWAAFLR